MSTLMDLQKMNLEKMAARDQEAKDQEAAPAVLLSRQQDIKTDSNIDDKTDSNTSIKPAIQTEVKPDRKSSGKKSDLPSGPRQKPSAQQSVQQDGPPPTTLDPLDQALLEKLRRPYADFSKGGSTLVSSRLPADIVERLNYAADLVKKHKKTKQDVITRGLILAFEELVKADGDTEWYE